MTKLSVNINKIATLRNARGGTLPDVIRVAKDCQRFGAEGITIHPRPDQRHITTQDVYQLADVMVTEYNIEGYPDERYLRFISDIKPHQATLVPDPPHVITSNSGWDVKKNFTFLSQTIENIKKWGVRTSLFLNPDPEQVAWAKKTGTDRIELYTENYAKTYVTDPKKAIKNYKSAAQEATHLGLEINAGHDLNLDNLHYFVQEIPHTCEVSIGHAIICDSLYYGLENTIGMYLRELNKTVK